MFTSVGRLIGYKIRQAVNNFIDNYFTDDSEETVYYVDDSMSTYLQYRDQ